MDYNQAIGQIWLLTRGQVIIAGFGGIVDINHIALWQNIDRFKDNYDIVDDRECFLGVLKLFHYFQEQDRIENMNKQK